MLCRYQFEMLRDSYRLEAYDKAIKAAVTFKKEFSSEELFILDIGANSGSLPMLAARHGADKVSKKAKLRCMWCIHMHTGEWI